MGCTTMPADFDWGYSVCHSGLGLFQSNFFTIKVYSDGKVLDSVGNLIGWTDPRRLEEIGLHKIYKDGEEVGAYLIQDPDSPYALAE